MSIRTHWSDRPNYHNSKFKLNSNEVVDPAHQQFIREFISTIQPNTIINYPDIKNAYLDLARLTNLSTDNLLLTSGAEQGIRSVLHVNTHNSTISISDPTFGLVEVYSELYGFKTIKSKYTNLQNNMHVQVLAGDITYVASPDNPTGTVLDNEDLNYILNNSRCVILDRTYTSALNDPMFELVKQHKNLYIVKSFSKMCGAAGLRLGYIVTDETNINNLYEWRPMFEINSIACYYIRYIVDNKDYIHVLEQRIIESKTMLEFELSKKYNIIPCSGNFVIVGYDRYLKDNLNKVCYTKDITIDGSNYIRITVPSIEIARHIISGI